MQYTGTLVQSTEYQYILRRVLERRYPNCDNDSERLQNEVVHPTCLYVDINNKLRTFNNQQEMVEYVNMYDGFNFTVIGRPIWYEEIPIYISNTTDYKNSKITITHKGWQYGKYLHEQNFNVVSDIRDWVYDYECKYR